MNFKIKQFGLVLIAGGMFLAGCSAHHQSKPQWVYGTHTQTQVRQHEYNVLNAQGAQVFVQGESVKMVIPSEDLFDIDSANLANDAQDLLNHVASYIKTYTIENLNVAAYSDSQAWAGMPHNAKLALTQRQSQVVGSYLWSRGIDMRFLNTNGFNGKSPVAWNGTPAGRNFNRRVEITFHFYPKLTSYN